MSDISVIEFAVYGVIGYSGVIMLLLSVIKDIQFERSLSMVRIGYMIIPMYCLFVLGLSGININMESTLETVITNTYVINGSTGAPITNSTVSETHSSASSFTLVNPVWVVMHYMFAISILVYILIQIYSALTKNN